MYRLQNNESDSLTILLAIHFCKQKHKVSRFVATWDLLYCCVYDPLFTTIPLPELAPQLQSSHYLRRAEHELRGIFLKNIFPGRSQTCSGLYCVQLRSISLLLYQSEFQNAATEIRYANERSQLLHSVLLVHLLRYSSLTMLVLYMALMQSIHKYYDILVFIRPKRFMFVGKEILVENRK